MHQPTSLIFLNCCTRVKSPVNIYIRLNILQEGKFQSKHKNVALSVICDESYGHNHNGHEKLRGFCKNSKYYAKNSMQTGHLIRAAGCAFPHPREDMRRLGESGTNYEVRRTLVLKR